MEETLAYESKLQGYDMCVSGKYTIKASKRQTRKVRTAQRQVRIEAKGKFIGELLNLGSSRRLELEMKAKSAPHLWRNRPALHIKTGGAVENAIPHTNSNANLWRAPGTPLGALLRAKLGEKKYYTLRGEVNKGTREEGRGKGRGRNASQTVEPFAPLSAKTGTELNGLCHLNGCLSSDPKRLAACTGARVAQRPFALFHSILLLLVAVDGDIARVLLAADIVRLEARELPPRVGALRHIVIVVPSVTRHPEGFDLRLGLLHPILVRQVANIEGRGVRRDDEAKEEER